MENILITGGTGLIGSRLTELLIQNGYSVTYLSRTGGKAGNIRKFAWDPIKGSMDEEALLDADYIINLAGAGVFDHKWSKEYKAEILASRVKAIHLIYEKLKGRNKWLKAFISASATGIYGTDTGLTNNAEDSPLADDFLAQVCKQWEAAADDVASLGIRTVKIRVGIVLSRKGGALEMMEATVKRGAGSALGSGKQYVSWIHIDDVCNMFIKALKDESMKGVYNGVAPNPVTNEELTQTLGEVLHKPIILPNVPAFALKLMIGSERAATVLGSSKINAEKVVKAGFKFDFQDLKPALENLYKS